MAKKLLELTVCIKENYDGFAKFYVSEEIIASFFEGENEPKEQRNCNLPQVSNLMPELEKIVSSRIKDAFDNGMQNYEKNELQAAIDTIKRLVPPNYFEGICC